MFPFLLPELILGWKMPIKGLAVSWAGKRQLSHIGFLQVLPAALTCTGN